MKKLEPHELISGPPAFRVFDNKVPENVQELQPIEEVLHLKKFVNDPIKKTSRRYPGRSFMSTEAYGCSSNIFRLKVSPHIDAKSPSPPWTPPECTRCSANV